MNRTLEATIRAARADAVIKLRPEIEIISDYVRYYLIDVLLPWAGSEDPMQRAWAHEVLNRFVLGFEDVKPFHSTQEAPSKGAFL